MKLAPCPACQHQFKNEDITGWRCPECEELRILECPKCHHRLALKRILCCHSNDFVLGEDK